MQLWYDDYLLHVFLMNFASKGKTGFFMKQDIIDSYNEWYHHHISGCDVSHSDLAELAGIATKLKTILENISDDDCPDIKYRKYLQIRALLTTLQTKKNYFAEEFLRNEKTIFSRPKDWLKPWGLQSFTQLFSEQFTNLIVTRTFIKSNDPESKLVNQLKDACKYVHSNDEYDLAYCWSLYQHITEGDDENLLKLFLNNVPLKTHTYIELLKLSIDNNLFSNYKIIANYILKDHPEIDLISKSLQLCFKFLYFDRQNKTAITKEVIQFLLDHNLDVDDEYTDFRNYRKGTKLISPYRMAQRANADESILELLKPKQDNTTEPDEQIDTSNRELTANSSIELKQKASDKDNKASNFDLIEAILIRLSYLKNSNNKNSENEENQSKQNYTKSKRSNNIQVNKPNEIKNLFRLVFSFLKGHYDKSPTYQKQLPAELIISITLFTLQVEGEYSLNMINKCLDMLTNYFKEINPEEIQALTIDNFFIWCKSHVSELKKIVKKLVENVRQNKISNNERMNLEYRLNRMYSLIPFLNLARQENISEYAVRTNNQNLINYLQKNNTFYLNKLFLHEMVCNIDLIKIYGIDKIKRFIDDYNIRAECKYPFAKEETCIREMHLITPQQTLGYLVNKLDSLEVNDIDKVLQCYYQVFPNDNTLAYCRSSKSNRSNYKRRRSLIDVLIERYHNKPHLSVLKLMREAIKQIDASDISDGTSNALNLAIETDFFQAISIILPAYKDHESKTHYAICKAGQEGKIKIFNYLLATFDRLDNSDQGIHILFSCMNDKMLPHMTDLSPILKEKGFTLSLKNKNGDTPLTYAAKNGDYAIVHWLISTYPELLNDKNGINALTTAIASKQTAIVALLLEKAVSPYSRDDNDNSAFTVASALDCSEQTNRIHRIIAKYYTVKIHDASSSSNRNSDEDEDHDQGCSSDKIQANDAEKVPLKRLPQYRPLTGSELDIDEFASSDPDTECIATTDSQYLKLLKESIENTIEKYILHTHRSHGFFHHHGATGRKRAINLLKNIENARSIEVVKQILIIHFAREEHHRIFFWRSKGGNLYDHSLDTYLMKMLSNNMTFKAFILNGKDLFENLKTYENRLVARRKFCKL